MTTSEYLSELVTFGGEILTRGQVMAILQSEGHSQVLIDRWLQGARSL